MKKTIILIASMFLLASCVESMALFGSGAANGKLTQSSINTAVGYGIKKQTGKSPLEHALQFSKKNKAKKNSFLGKPLMENTSSLQSSIDKKSRTKYLD